MLSGSMMRLVDGDNGVDNLWSDSLLVDDWLHCLVDMMVDVFALNSWCGSSRVSGFVGVGGVLELSQFSLESLASLMLVAMVEFLLDDRLHLVVMLLWEDFLVLDGLDSGVVVILVDLTVNRFSEFLMSGGLDVLAGDSWSNTLRDVGGVALAAGKLGNRGSGFIHCDVRWGGMG